VIWSLPSFHHKSVWLVLIPTAWNLRWQCAVTSDTDMWIHDKTLTFTKFVQFHISRPKIAQMIGKTAILTTPTFYSGFYLRHPNIWFLLSILQFYKQWNYFTFLKSSVTVPIKEVHSRHAWKYALIWAIHYSHNPNHWWYNAYSPTS
jgi:hypothetical protein